MRRQRSAVPPVEFTFIREQFIESAPRQGWPLGGVFFSFSALLERFGGFEDVLFSCLDRRKTGRRGGLAKGFKLDRYVTAVDFPWFQKARQQHNRRMQLRPLGSKGNATGPGSATKKNPMQALLAFMSFLRSSSLGGNLMQTWRTLLDPDGNLRVQQSDVQRACQQVGWRGDVSVLWQSLDASHGAALQEFGFKEARALALFWTWCQSVGSVKDAWSKLLGCERGYQRRRRNSVAALAVQVQQSAVESLDREAFVFGFSQVGSKVEDANYLFSILDWEPRGKLTYKDLRFLESWEPAKWLAEKADQREAQSFKEAVLSKYANHPVPGTVMPCVALPLLSGQGLETVPGPGCHWHLPLDGLQPSGGAHSVEGQLREGMAGPGQAELGLHHLARPRCRGRATAIRMAKRWNKMDKK